MTLSGAIAAPDHRNSLEAAEQAAWAMLREGADNRRHAFHQVALATVSSSGAPAVRTVVLRGAEEAARALRVHTDVRSRKFGELGADPRCEVLAYDHDAKVQVRATARAALHRADATSDAIFSRMRAMSRACYRQAPGPGAALEAPQTLDRATQDDEFGYQNFVVLELHVVALEWLYLAATGHRRCLISYGDEVRRRWLAP